MPKSAMKVIANQKEGEETSYEMAVQQLQR